MSNKTTRNKLKLAVYDAILVFDGQFSLPELQAILADQYSIEVAQRTLRRWLVGWVEEGVLQRFGQKRGTRYQLDGSIQLSTDKQVDKENLAFLAQVPPTKRSAVLAQLRDLWTHTSTAIEGNTLTLGDTHAVLELGLTVSGKPLREHQEIVGHAKAIDLIYSAVNQPLSKQLIFDLHKAVQTDIVTDIYQPIGDWKKQNNGTYAVTSEGKQVYIEYAEPRYIDQLMQQLITKINQTKVSDIHLQNAARHYAKIHMAIVHIHPFFDGNGRIGRLVANIPLIKAGLPPLLIQQNNRREYIEMLADYQLELGQLSNKTGLWPDENKLNTFAVFCQQQYQATIELLSR